MIMRSIFSIFLVLLGFYLVLGQTTRHIAVRRMLFLILILLGFVSIIFQDLWTNISVKLGVENGTALLTYLIAFGFISYVITTYKWKRSQEDQIVALARRLAINEFLNNKAK
jgi:hypothetical protein